MRLLVYARHELVGSSTGDPSAGETMPDAALLLEGSWRCRAQGPVACSSLDEVIEGRFDWIDQQAADFAELLGGARLQSESISPAYLNALALRYYLVKLIRPLAYLTEVRQLCPGDRLELVAGARRDLDYADVLRQYCRASGADYHVRWIEGGVGPTGGFPVNGRWRRWLARLAGYLQPTAEPGNSRRRVVLCGNPRLLDPVCRELLARRCKLWWLHDRFAVRSWLRWQAAGVGQLACDASLGRENRCSVEVPASLECRGVNLAVPIRRWLIERMATHGPRQTRLIETIDAHFRRVRPEALVLDEDATPLARAAVAVGSQHGAGSFVVQHGVPYCRFGFSPPAADRLLIWGDSSRQRLIDWGVPAVRIRVTGSPQHDHSQRLLWRPRGHEESKRPRILLLTTVPPRDERPDVVALHLTSTTYAQMLRMAFAAVAGIDGAELIVKLHPRSGHDPVVRALRAEFRSVASRLVRRGRLEECLAGVSCVLSCASSAGVEATLAGVPAIQLAPPGASGFLDHDRWGLLGTARTEAELRTLLARLAAHGWRAPVRPDREVFADFGPPAAARVADEVLGPLDSLPHDPYHKSTVDARPAVYVY